METEQDYHKRCLIQFRIGQKKIIQSQLSLINYLVKLTEEEFKDPLDFKNAYLTLSFGPDDNQDIIRRLKIKDYLK